MKYNDVQYNNNRDEPLIIRAFIETVFKYSKYPRVILEVFVRKNFGSRHFYLSRCLLVAIAMCIWPWLKYKAITMWGVNMFSYTFEQKENFESYFWSHYITWYLFIVFFLFFSFRRYAESSRKSGEMSFSTHSRNFGESHLFFHTIGQSETRRRLKEGNLSAEEYSALKFNGIRIVSTVYEPLGFFVGGLLLWYFDQSLGLPLVICSVLYSLGNWASFYFAEQSMLDNIDHMISARQHTEHIKRGRVEVGERPILREAITNKQNDTKDNDPLKVT